MPPGADSLVDAVLGFRERVTSEMIGFISTSAGEGKGSGILCFGTCVSLTGARRVAVLRPTLPEWSSSQRTAGWDALALVMIFERGGLCRSWESGESACSRDDCVGRVDCSPE